MRLPRAHTFQSDRCMKAEQAVDEFVAKLSKPEVSEGQHTSHSSCKSRSGKYRTDTRCFGVKEGSPFVAAACVQERKFDGLVRKQRSSHVHVAAAEEGRVVSRAGFEGVASIDFLRQQAIAQLVSERPGQPALGIQAKGRSFSLEVNPVEDTRRLDTEKALRNLKGRKSNLESHLSRWRNHRDNMSGRAWHQANGEVQSLKYKISKIDISINLKENKLEKLKR